MPVISITRLRVRSWFYLPAFVFASLRIAKQVKSAPGNLGIKLLNHRGNVFWTCTSWDSEAAMRAFMLARPHGPTMRKLLEWCDEAAVVHWTQDRLNSRRAEAHRRMRRGAKSKVNHPTEAHRKFEILRRETQGEAQSSRRLF
jgi:heme-degrading monooxygenase HmoA